MYCLYTSTVAKNKTSSVSNQMLASYTGFERSLLAASVAQLVEQRGVNTKGAGSSPARGRNGIFFSAQSSLLLAN